jgi:hypothetical protein
MAVGDVGMMGGLFVVAGLMMLRGLAVMVRGVRVVFGGFAVVLGCFLRHGPSFPAQ